ncbi:MAG: hypothetical protein KGD70_08100 [Candidatus Lokiarchaeota archaeon]|jgi:hypothetical protein|nr:hypothetical protein [Candidatus Lokiarchaeota archaeon]
MVDYSKILQNLEFFNISTDSFTIFEWKPPKSYKSYILDLNIVKKNPTSNIFFHIFKGEMKIVHIRLKNLIYTAGSNNEVQFQLLEALIEQVSVVFNEIYDIESYIKYDNFSTSMFSSFKEEIDKIISNFNSLNCVRDLKVPCMVCNGILIVIVKRSFIEDAESYPVPLVYNHKGHAILCFIDKNYDIRGVELVNVTG